MERDLTVLWICKPTEGIYLIQQNGNEISIHGMGIGNNRFDNIGFGKINNDQTAINGVWQDTLFSSNPQNSVKHSFKISIIDTSHLESKNYFNYGNFERKCLSDELKSFFTEE